MSFVESDRFTSKSDNSEVLVVGKEEVVELSVVKRAGAVRVVRTPQCSTKPVTDPKNC